MASNVSQDTIPYLWSSANDDVEFTFSFNPYSIDSIVTNAGYVRINLDLDFDVTPVVGEYIYLSTNIYIGTYKILSVTGTNNITIDLAYTSSITSHIYYCYHLRIPTFDIYKGFNTGEGGTSFSINLPYTKVVSIKPPILYNSTTNIPYLSINLKGIVKYIFNITANVVANSIDYSMFNVVRLTWDGLQTVQNVTYSRNYVFILNSAITNEELKRNYISATINNLFESNGYTYLTPIDKPLIATQGTTFATAFTVYIEILIYIECLPTVHKFINGVKQ